MSQGTLSSDPASVNPQPFGGEVFRDIPDFPDYQASTFGRIRSCCKYFRNPRGEWRILKALPNAQRSSYVFIKPLKDGKRYTRAVHRVVLETFVGPRPPGMQACHNDGDLNNNRLENLRWDTPRANAEDKKRYGKVRRGENVPTSKLKSHQVRIVYCMAYFNYPRLTIAKRYGVRPEAIHKITSGQRWAFEFPWRKDCTAAD